MEEMEIEFHRSFLFFVHKETGMFTLSGEGANAIEINIDKE